MGVPVRSGGGRAPRVPNTAVRRYDDAVRLSAAARRRLDQGIEVLDRLVPLSRRLSRLVGAYTLVVGLAAGVIVITLVVRFWPASFVDVVAHLIIAAVVLAPVAMLWLFHRALAEVLLIPERLTAMPTVAREHGAELAGLVRDAQGRRGRVRVTSLPGDLWRSGRLLLAAHVDLPGYGAVLTLVSVPFLVAALGAAFAGLMLILLAPAVVAGAVLTAVV
jgi:hypothetical protein